MNLNKSNCRIKMRLVPYGSGWADVYVDFGDGEPYFIISDVMGESFETLMQALYHLYPDNRNPENAYELIEYKYGICENINGECVVTRIVDDTTEEDLLTVISDIP